MPNHSPMRGISIERFGEGRDKIALFLKSSWGDTLTSPGLLEAISRKCQAQVLLFDIDDPAFRNPGNSWPTPEDAALLDASRKKYHLAILETIRAEGVGRCLFLGSLHFWESGFLEELKKTAAVGSYLGDDDVASVAERIAKPYVRNYDVAFCACATYKDGQPMEDVYRTWGAPRARFLPLGLRPSKFDVSTADDAKRDIDVIYVGGVYIKKVWRVLLVKWYFGKRMRLYGRGWNRSVSPAKTFILKALKFALGVGHVEELPESEFVATYRRAKIGFNIHQEYGPTNYRLYELPGNGVMQVCDNPDGLARVFAPGTEIVGYRNPIDAIIIIRKYLKDDEARRAIAAAGRERCLRDYRTEDMFALAAEELRRTLREKTSAQHNPTKHG